MILGDGHGWLAHLGRLWKRRGWVFVAWKCKHPCCDSVCVCVEKRRWWFGLKWVDWLWHCDWEKKRCAGGGNGGGRREVAEEEVFSFGYKGE